MSRSASFEPRAATRPPTIGMMSVVVLPISMSSAPNTQFATHCAVASQFAEATYALADYREAIGHTTRTDRNGKVLFVLR